MLRRKKKLAELEKRIADLEVQVQSQQMDVHTALSVDGLDIGEIVKNYNERMTKHSPID